MTIVHAYDQHRGLLGVFEFPSFMPRPLFVTGRNPLMGRAFIIDEQNGYWVGLRLARPLIEAMRARDYCWHCE